MIDVFGDQSRNALANMLAANDNKDGDEVSVLCVLCQPLAICQPIDAAIGQPFVPIECFLHLYFFITL